MAGVPRCDVIGSRDVISDVTNRSCPPTLLQAPKRPQILAGIGVGQGKIADFRHFSRLISETVVSNLHIPQFPRYLASETDTDTTYAPNATQAHTPAVGWGISVYCTKCMSIRFSLYLEHPQSFFQLITLGLEMGLGASTGQADFPVRKLHDEGANRSPPALMHRCIMQVLVFYENNS